MFRSVLRPSGVNHRTLCNYYVSACLPRRIPVCFLINKCMSWYWKVDGRIVADHNGASAVYDKCSLG